MFLNRNLNQRMPKNPLKEIANKRRGICKGMVEIKQIKVVNTECESEHKTRL